MERFDSQEALTLLMDERITVASEQGMAALADAVVERWFTPEFRAEPSILVERVRQMVLKTPAHGYAACCAATRRRRPPGPRRSTSAFRIPGSR